MNKLDLTSPRQRTFGSILTRQAQENGEELFLITDDERITFAQADIAVNSLAEGLRSLGVEARDRVALMLGNRTEMVLLTLAINRLGAIWTPINAEYRGEWLLDNLTRCRYKVLVTDEGLQDRIASLQDKLGDETIVLIGDAARSPLKSVTSYEQLLVENNPNCIFPEANYGDTCSILWTSGTTGKSKGVMQSYNCWIRAITAGASKQYDTCDGDIVYCALPLYHSAAWVANIYRALIEGIACVIEKKFSVSNFWYRINEFGATQTFLLGAMGMFLLNAPTSACDADTTLHTASITPMSPDQREVFTKRFGVHLVRNGMGQSECLLMVAQTENRSDVPQNSVGFAAADSEVCLMDDDGKPSKDGEIGELCIKPLEDHVVFNGYFDDEAATEDAYYGEWYRSGDLARKDPVTGAFYFVDRKKDAIRFAGRNISTMEVESVVLCHPSVNEVAAFGIPAPDTEGEHELKLNIILKDGTEITEEEICAYVNDNAPHYFVPRYIEFVDSLPMTPTSKVQKYKLRDSGVTDKTWDLENSGYHVKR